MPISDKKLATQPRTEPASTMLRLCRTSKTPISPSASPTHCRRDFLVREAVGECRGHDRLESQDERGDPGGYAVTDRGEHASEAKSVHQRACNEAMADLIRMRP